jgi:hypothetical protein
VGGTEGDAHDPWVAGSHCRATGHNETFCLKCVEQGSNHSAQLIE